MAYATPQEIHDRYAALYETLGLTAPEWQPPLAFAGAIIDSYLASRYTVPFATDPANTPAIIKQLAITLAVADIADRFPGLPDWIARAREWAMSILEKLSAGDMEVVGTTGTLVPTIVDQASTIRSSTGGYVPTFGVAPSLSERVDPNRALDELAERGFFFEVDP